MTDPSTTGAPRTEALARLLGQHTTFSMPQWAGILRDIAAEGYVVVEREARYGCTCTIHEDRGEPCQNRQVICASCWQVCWGIEREAGDIDVPTLERAMAQLRRDKVSPALRREGGWTMLTESDAPELAAIYARLRASDTGRET